MIDSLLRIANNRRCLVVAIYVGVLAAPLVAQEAADPALELYYSANAAYNRKLYPVAIANYGEFLGRYGTHAKAQLARHGLGLSHFALKQYPQAAPEFLKLLEERTLDKKIDRGRLSLLHAQCLLYTDKKDEALKRLITAATTLKPSVHCTGAIAGVADLYFEKKDWPNTIAWAKKLKGAGASAGQLIRAEYQEGFALYKLEKMPEAIEVLDKAKAAAMKEKSEAWVTRIGYLLSECHVSNKSLDKGEAALQEALLGLSGTAAIDARYRLATIKYSSEKWLNAQADFETFLKENKKPKEEDPRVRESQFRIARCLMEQGEQRKASDAFRSLSAANDEVAARAVLWRGRLYSRNTEQNNRYATAAGVLHEANGKAWYAKGFPTKHGEEPSNFVADIDFEHANAHMLHSQPKWEEALGLLGRVRARRPNYPQMAQVISQQAICQHKLKQFPESFKTTTYFIKNFAADELAGDVRFLLAENLFLMKRLDEAIAAYGKFLATDKEHDKQLAAEFRVAQIHHHQQKWAESNKRAVPLFARKPEGDLFTQLAFVVGENYFRLNKWAEAVEPFESFLATYVVQPADPKGKIQLKKGPNVDTALMQLGIAYTRLGKKEEAIGHLDMLVKFYSTTTTHLPLALSELGKLLYETGDLKRSRDMLTLFVRYRADKANALFKSATFEVGRVHYYLGWIDATQKLYPQAAENFQIAAANGHGRLDKDGNPLDSDAVLQQGIALVNAKEFEKAAAHLQNVVNRYKTHPRKDLVTYYTGLAYARIEKWPQAAAFFQRVVTEHPKATFADKAVYEWAWCERAQKRNKEATQRYELLLKNYPQSELVTKVQSELAELNLDVDAQDAVIAKLTETLKSVTDPKMKFELQYQLASAHFKKKDYENSAKMFEALIPDGAKSALLPSILFQAGESRLALTETIPAREHYLTAHKVPNTPRALAESILLRLAETQNLTGQHKAAQDSYHTFLNGYRESKWLRNARYGMAYAMEKQELYAKAIGEYAKLLSSDAAKPVAMDKWMVQGRYQIGECYFNLKQYDKAMAEFISVDTNARGYPDWQAKAVLEMGRLLLSQDKRPEAMDRLKEVLKRFPKTKAAAVAQKYLDELRSGS